MWNQVPEIKITHEKPRKRLNNHYFTQTPSTSDSLLKLRPPEIDLEWMHFDKKSPSNSPSFKRSPGNSRLAAFPNSPKNPSFTVYPRSPNPRSPNPRSPNPRSPNPKSPNPRSPNPQRIKTFISDQVFLDQSPLLAPESAKINQLNKSHSISQDATEDIDFETVNEYLRSAKEYFGQIREEAKVTFEGTKEMILLGKKKKDGKNLLSEGKMVSDTFNLEAKKSILKLLESNLEKLNNRVNFWEEKSGKQAEESSFIMSKIELLNIKVKNEKVKEKVNGSKSQKCLSSCLIF